MRNRQAYLTDLNDTEWAASEPLLMMSNAIFYGVPSGGAWRLLPRSVAVLEQGDEIFALVDEAARDGLARLLGPVRN